jgi:hypothetical protein
MKIRIEKKSKKIKFQKEWLAAKLLTVTYCGLTLCICNCLCPKGPNKDLRKSV